MILEGLRGAAFPPGADFVTSPVLAAWVQRTVAERTAFTSFPAFQRLGPGDGAMLFYRFVIGISRSSWHIGDD